MVNIRITQKELEELIIWGRKYQSFSKDVEVPFESDEIKLLEKLRSHLKTGRGGNDG